MAVEFYQRSGGRIDVTSEAWFFEDRMSKDVVTLGEVQWSGERMRTHLVGTEYIENYPGLRLDSTKDTDTRTWAA